MRGYVRHGARHDPGMDEMTDDERVAQGIAAVALDLLDRLDPDPGVRSCSRWLGCWWRTGEGASNSEPGLPQTGRPSRMGGAGVNG